MTGDELKRQRGRLRLTQRELAVRIGVGLRTVTTWESLRCQAGVSGRDQVRRSGTGPGNGYKGSAVRNFLGAPRFAVAR